MLCLIPEDVDSKFGKRHVDARDIATSNKQLDDQQEKPMGQHQKPVKAEEIQSDAPSKNEDDIRKMPGNHERMWSGQLVEINITELTIDLVPDAKPIKSPPYRAGPKTRVLRINKCHFFNAKLNT